MRTEKAGKSWRLLLHLLKRVTPGTRSLKLPLPSLFCGFLPSAGSGNWRAASTIIVLWNFAFCRMDNWQSIRFILSVQRGIFFSFIANVSLLLMSCFYRQSAFNGP